MSIAGVRVRNSRQFRSRWPVSQGICGQAVKQIKQRTWADHISQNCMFIVSAYARFLPSKPASQQQFSTSSLVLNKQHAVH